MNNVQLKTKYLPVNPGSQFVRAYHYIIKDGKEYDIQEAIEKLNKAKIISPDIYLKLTHKRTSARTAALTIMEYLYLLD